MNSRSRPSRNKENQSKDESLISASFRQDKDSLTSRLPAKVLPTFIFSLHPSKTPEKILQKTPSKKTLTRNASTRKSLKSSKKSLQNKSVLSENPQKTLRIPKNPSKINIKNLIKAINEHCCSCPRFKEELKKKELF